MPTITIDQLRTHRSRHVPIRSLRGRAWWRALRRQFDPKARERREAMFLMECRARLKIAQWQAKHREELVFMYAAGLGPLH